MESAADEAAEDAAASELAAAEDADDDASEDLPSSFWNVLHRLPPMAALPVPVQPDNASSAAVRPEMRRTERREIFIRKTSHISKACRRASARSAAGSCMRFLPRFRSETVLL